MRREPVLTWAAIAAAIHAAQAPAPIPWWAHAAIAVATSLGAGRQARRRVNPLAND